MNNTTGVTSWGKMLTLPEHLSLHTVFSV